MPKWVAYLFMLQFWEEIGWICYFSIIFYNVMCEWITTPSPSLLLPLSPVVFPCAPFLSLLVLSHFLPPGPPGNSAQLAEKLKLSDPLVLERRPGDRDLEPDWLVQLRRQHKELEVSRVIQGHIDWTQKGPVPSPGHLLSHLIQRFLFTAFSCVCLVPQGGALPSHSCHSVSEVPENASQPSKLPHLC